MVGSTDASTIAQRTQLEAQLREAQDALNDSYYNHAMDSRADALDMELEYFEKGKMDYLESFRESVKETDILIEETYQKVLTNSDIVLSELERMSNEYGFYIEDNLTSPWENAKYDADTFKDTTSTHIQTVYQTVSSVKPNMSADLGAPWEEMTSIGGPIYQYSTYARDVLDQAVIDAQGEQDDMKDALQKPWESLLGIVNQYPTDTAFALGEVIKYHKAAATEIEKAYEGKIPSYYADPIPSSSGTAPGTTSINTSGGNKGTTSRTSTTDNKGTGPYSGSYNNDVGRLQVVLVEAFGYPVGKKNGTYVYTPDGLWGSTTKASVKKMQTTIGAQQTGKYDQQTYNKLSTWLTNKYNNDSDTNRWQRALQYMPTAFAKGTLGTTKDQLAITDESWIGEEITLAAGKNGQLQYLKKGSAVMPADISANLVEWGKMNPNMMNVGNMADGINLMSNYINKPEIKVDVENFLKVGTVSKDTLPELEKLMDKKIDTFAKQLNASIRKFK
jgi:hypothetical protein